MVVCALTYQPSALFYVVPMAGALIARRERTHRDRALDARARRRHLHLARLAYCTMTALYSAGVFVKSGRVAFEHHWGDKIAWFLSEALPNALSLFVLNDNNHRDHALYLGCAAVVGLILAAGAYLEWQRHGRERGIVWRRACSGCRCSPSHREPGCLRALRDLSHRARHDRRAGVFPGRVAPPLTERWNPANVRLIAALAFTVAFVIARHHVYALIAVPQGNEWELILEGAKHVHLTPAVKPRIFAIASSPADISTATIYHDEFGSLSSNSEWVPKEMFKRAMHDLHPEIANINARYEFSEGYKLPAGQHYDLIIDMRRLRQFYTDN
jgi:hypothetical protein